MGESVNGRDGSVGGLVCYQRSSVNIAFRRARTNQGGKSSGAPDRAAIRLCCARKGHPGMAATTYPPPVSGVFFWRMALGRFRPGHIFTCSSSRFQLHCRIESRAESGLLWMTADALITELGKRGIEISRRTLFSYQAADPGEAPEKFDSVDDWARFILERQAYEPGRTQSTEKREAKERRAMSRNGRQQAKRNLANGDSDAEKFSLGAERKERILRLRLSNQVRRSKLEVLSRNTVTMAECEQALEGIKKACEWRVASVAGNFVSSTRAQRAKARSGVVDRGIAFRFGSVGRAETYL